MNALIYARASNASPDARVVADQIAACRGLCERSGWAVIGAFDDRSSASGKLKQKNRPGLRALLERVEGGGIDYVVVDAADRIARDRGDISATQKRLERAGARLITVSDSQETGIAVTFLALFDTAFRDDRIARIKRGTRAAVAARRGDSSK